MENKIHNSKNTTHNSLKFIEIKTEGTLLLFGVNDKKKLVQLYYGTACNVSDYTDFFQSPLKGDEHLPACSVFGGNDNWGGLRITHSDSELSLELKYIKHYSKKIDNDRVQTVIILSDRIYPLNIELHCTSYYKDDVITMKRVISHNESKEITLHSYPSAEIVLNPTYNNVYITYLQGLWERENNIVEEKLSAGKKVLENRYGLWSSFGFNPAFMISPYGQSDENSGTVIGGALAWTGNWKMTFDINHGKLFHDNTERRDLVITAGINDFSSEYHLKQGEVFTTPEFIFTFSENGKGQISRNLHRWARKNILRDGDKLRSILLNSWEGAYFTFDEDKLLSMMDGLKKMGGEMFVLDDGWFGNGQDARNNASAGLGDWQTNSEKLPHGLSFLADEAEKRGLKFGIWVEPEMVNPQSKLFRKHPEWAIQQPDREKILYRSQLVLDLSNPAVREFVFNSVANILRKTPGISYVKWDSNRPFTNIGSTYLTEGYKTHLWVEYIKGLYEVYDRLMKEFPNVTFQACASGGGRIDYGILKYNHEFWTSDNTDALQRIFIQWGTNFFYPAIATAAHVTICPNHQTGRITPIKYRFDVAMSGRLGLELNPDNMSEDDLEFAISAVNEYKRIRNVVYFGDLYRLISPYESDYAALIYVMPDKTRAIMFVYNLTHLLGIPAPEIKIHGLDNGKRYKITEINKQNNLLHSSSDNKVIGGNLLKTKGIKVHFSKPFDSAVFELQES